MLVSSLLYKCSTNQRLVNADAISPSLSAWHATSYVHYTGCSKI